MLVFVLIIIVAIVPCMREAAERALGFIGIHGLGGFGFSFAFAFVWQWCSRINERRSRAGGFVQHGEVRRAQEASWDRI